MNRQILLASLIFSSIMLSNCGDDDNTPDTVTIQGSQVTTAADSSTVVCLPSSAPNDIAVIACLFYDESVVVVVGETSLTITASSEPDHKSMYYETTNALYEDYNEDDNEDFYKRVEEMLSSSIWNIVSMNLDKVEGNLVELSDLGEEFFEEYKILFNTKIEKA